MCFWSPLGSRTRIFPQHLLLTCTLQNAGNDGSSDFLSPVSVTFMGSQLPALHPFDISETMLFSLSCCGLLRQDPEKQHRFGIYIRDFSKCVTTMIKFHCHWFNLLLKVESANPFKIYHLLKNIGSHQF